MKKTPLNIALACAGLLFFTTANAHDPSEHHSKNEAPDCSAMENMDKMDKMDPVMMAMMQQCGGEHKKDMDHEHRHDKDEHDDAHEGSDHHH